MSYKIDGRLDGRVLNAALVEDGIESHVTSGENAGRKLIHDRIVRTFKTVRLDDGGVGEAILDIPEDAEEDRLSVVAYVQRNESMAIEGAGASRLERVEGE